MCFPAENVLVYARPRPVSTVVLLAVHTRTGLNSQNEHLPPLPLSTSLVSSTPCLLSTLALFLLQSMSSASANGAKEEARPLTALSSSFLWSSGSLRTGTNGLSGCNCLRVLSYMGAFLCVCWVVCQSIHQWESGRESAWVCAFSQ